MGGISRMTFFKLSKPEDQDACVAAYGKLFNDQTRNGKPYIVSCEAHKLYDDPRSQGYTVVGKTVFESLDDMKFYDEECAAHKALKASVGPNHEGGGPPMTVYMDS